MPVRGMAFFVVVESTRIKSVLQSNKLNKKEDIIVDWVASGYNRPSKISRRPLYLDYSVLSLKTRSCRFMVLRVERSLKQSILRWLCPVKIIEQQAPKKVCTI